MVRRHVLGKLLAREAVFKEGPGRDQSWSKGPGVGEGDRHELDPGL